MKKILRFRSRTKALFFNLYIDNYISNIYNKDNKGRDTYAIVQITVTSHWEPCVASSSLAPTVYCGVAQLEEQRIVLLSLILGII